METLKNLLRNVYTSIAVLIVIFAIIYLNNQAGGRIISHLEHCPYCDGESGHLHCPELKAITDEILV